MVSPSPATLARAALRRRAARRGERGAAVFIVVMAIVLLTGIGVFAVRTASMVDLAAGYDRQATQTHHLSELAGRTAAAYTEGSGGLVRMMLNTRELTPERCLANINPATGTVPAGMVCYRLDYARLEERIDAVSPDTNTLLAAQEDDDAGSLGPQLGDAAGFTTPLEGQLLIELTDPNEKGEGAGTSGKFEITVTAHAQIRPSGTGVRPWCAPQNSSMGASVHLLRAHLGIPR
jgi:hypothetical protein